MRYLLETAGYSSVPPWAYGVIAFALLVCLFLVRSLGHRRPRSR